MKGLHAQMGDRKCNFDLAGLKYGIYFQVIQTSDNLVHALTNAQCLKMGKFA